MDHSIFHRHIAAGRLYPVVSVDDIVLTGDKQSIND